VLENNNLENLAKKYNIENPLIESIFGHRLNFYSREASMAECLNIFYSQYKHQFNEEYFKKLKKENLVKFLFEITDKNLEDEYPKYKEKFETFEVFKYSIKTLQKMALNGDFIYPHSFNMLFYIEDSKKNYFTRSGELLFLMIKRSQNFEEFKNFLVDKFQTSKFDNIVNKLDVEYFAKDELLGYLPYKKHIVFDMLTNELITILKLPIPKRDIFYYFSLISGFFMSFYILNVAKDDVYFIVEILNNKSDEVRRKSRENYRLNEEAIVNKIKNKATKHKIKIETLKSKISKITDAHRGFLKDILASRENTNAYRYLLSDEFLKLLILLNVKKEMQFEEFLELLFEKYKIIIGEKEIEKKLKLNSYADFRKNRQRLKERIKMLGLGNEKSDGDFYIKVEL